MARNEADGLHLSETWDDGAALLRAAGEQDLEGIVSKHRNASYRSGPTDAWTKVKVPEWTEANRREVHVVTVTLRCGSRVLKPSAWQRAEDKLRQNG